jgi:hypothetical protein
MNSTNTKTLLITTALAVRLLSIAQGLCATKVQDDATRVPGNDIEFEGFTIEHEHAEYGPQRLLVDQIHQNLYTVSFVGREEYLEMIGTQGWESSAEALVNYLVDLNPELELSLEEFRCSEIGDKFVVYSLVSEDELAFDADSELGRLFFGKLLANASQELDAIIDAAGAAAFEEIVRPVEEAVQTDAIDETVDAGSQAADHPDDVDSERVASFRRKAMKFIASPMGIAACVGVLGLMVVGARCVLSGATDGASEELLG